MKNAHSAFFAVVMCLKEATGDRTCESADQTDQFLSVKFLMVKVGFLMSRLLKRGGIFF